MRRLQQSASLIAVHTDPLPSQDAAETSGKLQGWVSEIGFPNYPSVQPQRTLEENLPRGLAQCRREQLLTATGAQRTTLSK